MILYYNSLLQNATDIITKCDSYFITKRNRSLLQNTSVFYYKMRQLYDKIRQLLQNVTFITNRESINIDWTKPIKFLDKLTEKNYNSQNLIDFVTHKTSKNLTLCLKLVFINLFIEHFVHLEASVHLEEKRLT